MFIMSLKRYQWGIYLVLIATGIYISADLFWAVVGARMDVVNWSPSTTRSATAETPERRPFQQYAVIQERNLFGARGRATAPPPPRTPPPAATPSRQALNLKLVGTVVGTADHTYAVIEDLSAKRQDLYRLGDLVKEAKVIEITRNRVVLDNRGRREELLSFEKLESAPPSAEAPPRPAGLPRPPVRPPEPRDNEPRAEEPPPEDDIEIERVSENLWRINRDELVEQLDNVGAFMKDARLTPHFNAGQPDGFMVSNLPANSVLARMGLRNGDIMKGVNGQRFTSLEDVLQIYQQLQSEPTLQLEIERGNRTEMITYEIR